jgi:hypothetical protein
MFTRKEHRMTDATTRDPKFVAFPEMTEGDRHVGAVLVTRDADTNVLKAHVREVPGEPGPDPEIVAALVQSYEIRGLTERGDV